MHVMYVRILGDDDTLKIKTYHVSWLLSGNNACTTITTNLLLLLDNLLNQCSFLLPTILYLRSTQHFFMVESSAKYYRCLTLLVGMATVHFIHTTYVQIMQF